MRLRLKTVLIVMACLAVVTAAALAPLWIFHAQDTQMLGQVHSYQPGGGALRFDPEDILVVRDLYRLEEATTESLARESKTLSEDSPAEKETLLPRLREYVTALVNAGALPSLVQELLESPMEGVRFTHGIDTLGYEHITLYYGNGESPLNHYLYLIVDIATDLVTSFQMWMPLSELPAEMDGRAMLNAYMRDYLGLGVVDDWRAIPEVDPVSMEGMINQFSQCFSDTLKVSGILHFQFHETDGWGGFNIVTQSFHLAGRDELEMMFPHQ